MRAYDTWVQCVNILKAIDQVREVYNQAFAEVCRTTDGGVNASLEGAELDSCIFENYIVPLKTLINLFYATGNPQPQNAVSYRKILPLTHSVNYLMRLWTIKMPPCRTSTEEINAYQWK